MDEMKGTLMGGSWQRKAGEQSWEGSMYRQLLRMMDTNTSEMAVTQALRALVEHQGNSYQHT